jgi:hypothetical protein
MAQHIDTSKSYELSAVTIRALFDTAPFMHHGPLPLPPNFDHAASKAHHRHRKAFPHAPFAD